MRLISLILATLALAGPALAENRAVVIVEAGADGATAPPAAAAAEAAGFAVTTATDLTAAGLREAMAALLRPDSAPGARLVLLDGRFLHGGGDAWFLGQDAGSPDLLAVAARGVSLSTLMGLMRDGKPGAVLLLGSDGARVGHGAGLQDGIGPLVPPPGVTVLSGSPDAVAAAGAALMRAGTTVGQVLAADDRLAMAEGGDAGLVLVPGEAAAPTEAERDLWARAAAADTPEAYRDYLSAHPAGAYAAAARARLAGLGMAESDRDQWAEAAATNTVAAYEAYLARHPDGKFAAAARRRLSEMRTDGGGRRPAADPAPAPLAAPGQAEEARLGLSRADRVTIQRRLNALGLATGGVDGIFGARSRQAIRSWQRHNGHAVTGYLTAAQIAQMRDQAAGLATERAREDEAYWARTGAHGGADNLRAYLARYPDGLHARAARRRLAEIEGASDEAREEREERAWEQARRADSVQSYSIYLQNWPRGEHAEEARERLDRKLRRGLTGGNPLQISPEAILRELLR